MTKMSHFLVTQGQDSGTFPRDFFVDFIVTCGTFCKLYTDTVGEKNGTMGKNSVNVKKMVPYVPFS